MLATRVAELNQRIASATGSGQTPNDLLDQRDQAISELSAYVQVTRIDAGDGTVSLFVGGGQKLVLAGPGDAAGDGADSYDATKLQLGVNDSGSLRMLSQELLTGGSIAGLMRFQNEDLVAARNQLGQPAAAVAGSVNRQQALGLDGSQPPGSGAPLLAVGAPRVLPASGNSGGGNVSISVAEPTELQASDYELLADPRCPPAATR